jgi:multicomponent Na+:H+ antiporter subunit G
MIWIIYVFIGFGMVFQILGALALLRFPDVYTRLHGATKCTTFGSIFIYLGVIIYGLASYFSGNAGFLSLSVHTFLVLSLLMVTNPTGAHAIARAAHRSGVKPRYAVIDRLNEYSNREGSK